MTGVQTCALPISLARVAADHAAWRNAADPSLEVGGSPARVRAAIEPFYAAGATSVILQPTGDEPDLEGFLGGVGEVTALLAGD